VVPDGVEVGVRPPLRQWTKTTAPARSTMAREWHSPSGFPPRELTEQAIVQILREHGGKVKIRDEGSGWNVYDDIAARLGVSIAARRRLIGGHEGIRVASRGWLCEKDLEQQGVIAPTETSGRGVWQLAKN